MTTPNVKDKPIRLLSEAWEAYVLANLEHRYYYLVLHHIQECQKLIFSEPLKKEGSQSNEGQDRG